MSAADASANCQIASDPRYTFTANMIAKAAKLAVVAATCTLALQAQADTISGLVSTGYGLSAGSVDYNYAFSRVQGSAFGTTTSSGTYGVVTSNGSYPLTSNTYWPLNTEASSWLTPTALQGTSFDRNTGLDGIYNWTLQFDLSGKNASTAQMSLKWFADDFGKAYLNGVELTQGASNWEVFSVNSGFVDGVNSLRFEVTNYNSPYTNPTGVRVEFISSYVSAVPEPSTYGMLLAGLGALGLGLRLSSGRGRRH
ncbi:PEP-CTERM sorting domain-containing protein [Aquincola tertiaricarbonis]|uniref:PEP-CTERM sorting domain-containing protein n=1 Tax=Aquincola tertiaricarbonis TaxID=391953 RepID=A0ABY4S3L4_AQUTE|nr:PEP-CTERM sorting domain-containing protein [Aquincola tertiaricarbonis]URI05819.1 PEP-CTERM sorting domain-containing protein [Aquincola tertiaricarbonis]